MSILTAAAVEFAEAIAAEGFSPRIETAARNYARALREFEASRSLPATPRAATTGAVFPNYGRAKGQPVAGASRQDLEHYAAGARRTLADESKARFHDKERALLAAIEAELAKQESSF